jgi:hypothetical protein
MNLPQRINLLIAGVVILFVQLAIMAGQSPSSVKDTNWILGFVVATAFFYLGFRPKA